MRTIPFSFFILISSFYILLTISFMRAIMILFKTDYTFLKKKLHILHFLWVVAVLSSFFCLFVFPLTPGTTDQYKIYFVFNAVFLTDILIKIPLASGWLATKVFRMKIAKMLVGSGAVLSAGLFITLLTGFTVGKNALQIRRVTLSFSSLPAGFDDFTILQLSDLHLGGIGKNSAIPGTIKKVVIKENPDIIVFTGDLVNNFRSEISPRDLALFSETGVKDKFAILGNHDYGDYFRWGSEVEKNSNFQGIINYYHKTGIRLLRNENVPIASHGDTLFLIGVENWGHTPFPKYADLRKALSGIQDSTFRILLTHDPAHWEQVISGRETIQLTLSGHTHGLQWGIKLGGLEFSLMKLIRQQWGGLFGKKENYVYVNRGLGTIGFPLRIDMLPEITIIKLRKIEN